MIKKSFLLGAIASVIAINSVFADTIVTSKSYVDTTRQATIPAAETNIETPGVSVVTYTDTAGTIGERGIFNPETDFDGQNNTIAPGHEGDLVTATCRKKPSHTEFVPVGLMVSHIPMRIVCCGIWWMKPFMVRSVIQMQTVPDILVFVLASIICVIVHMNKKTPADAGVFLLNHLSNTTASSQCGEPTNWSNAAISRTVKPARINVSVSRRNVFGLHET